MGAVLTGCEKPATTTGTADTNAPAAPTSTNK